MQRINYNSEVSKNEFPVCLFEFYGTQIKVFVRFEKLAG